MTPCASSHPRPCCGSARCAPLLPARAPARVRTISSLNCLLPQGDDDWPAMPSALYQTPQPRLPAVPPPPEHGPVRRRRGKQQWAVPDLLVLEHMPIPAFDTAEEFGKLLFPVRAPFFAEQYYMLDLAYKVKWIAGWCKYLVPPNRREV